MSASLEDIEEGMANLAWLMRLHGKHGLGALPVFERLEREREKLLNVDQRLDAAMARARQPRRPPKTSADLRSSHISDV